MSRFERKRREAVYLRKYPCPHYPMNTETVICSLPIRINDQLRSVPGNSTLMSVLKELRHTDGKHVIVALNGVFIRSADWASQRLRTDDSLMVIEATG